MSNPKILSFEDIEKIKQEELEQDRTLQRNIHYTISESTTNEELQQVKAHFKEEGKEMSGDFLSKQIRPYAGRNTFRISDITNVYFFHEG